MTTLIIPAQQHITFDGWCSVIIFSFSTVGDPGAQGIGITGMHGAGVNTPIAAAVAAITAGLFGELHIPNGGMFTTGSLSIMLAAGPTAWTSLG
jgi:hypothetical protein